MAKERGWHCMYTRACLFERVSAPVRVPGTHLVCCSTHATAMQAQRFTQGRQGAELVAARSTPLARRGGSS